MISILFLQHNNTQPRSFLISGYEKSILLAEERKRHEVNVIVMPSKWTKYLQGEMGRYTFAEEGSTERGTRGSVCLGRKILSRGLAAQTCRRLAGIFFPSAVLDL
ncbi:hypothetical protein CDAR_535861 [Caerostris darwini]|uniref:Uncharacterized protein n=1 Tax=Caerostris darwini TaxID=1538125 RepID=A0AAV4QPQ8_9ARAC|nr:hypothetical protein CDAR_535861 [Caerostris darwini]